MVGAFDDRTTPALDKPAPAPPRSGGERNGTLPGPDADGSYRFTGG